MEFTGSIMCITEPLPDMFSTIHVWICDTQGKMHDLAIFNSTKLVELLGSGINGIYDKHHYDHLWKSVIDFHKNGTTTVFHTDPHGAVLTDLNILIPSQCSR